MKTLFKSVSIILTLVLLLNIFMPISALASTDVYYLTSEFKNNGEHISPNRAGTEVLIFVAGILVGWIADGVIIYNTGHSGGEWVSIALEFWLNNPQYSSIHISSSGRVHGGSSGGF